MNDDEKNIKGELNELAGAVGGIVLHKKRKKGTHMGFGTVTDPKVGAATAIKPGEVRNPGGRPKNTPITDALRKLLTAPFPLKYAKELDTPRNLTWAEAIAWSALYDLIKNPDYRKFEAYAARTDGPLAENKLVEMDERGLPSLDIPDQGSARENLRVLTERLRLRIELRQSRALAETAERVD